VVASQSPAFHTAAVFVVTVLHTNPAAVLGCIAAEGIAEGVAGIRIAGSVAVEGLVGCGRVGGGLVAVVARLCWRVVGVGACCRRPFPVGVA